MRRQYTRPSVHVKEKPACIARVRVRVFIQQDDILELFPGEVLVKVPESLEVWGDGKRHHMGARGQCVVRGVDISQEQNKISRKEVTNISIRIVRMCGRCFREVERILCVMQGAKLLFASTG